MTNINPYISFDGECRDAMTFYHQCIGGELDMQMIEGSAIETQCPPEMKHQILHSALTKDSLVLMASDLVPEKLNKGNNITLNINCSSEDEINSLFAKLSTGGTIKDPLAVMFWGAMYGSFIDKFGIRWMLNYDKNIQPQ